ncbi:MAG: arginine--tRNA ligase [Pseudomonadota bacterium]
MTDLATRLAEACASAFEAEGLDPKWGAVKQSDRPELADFQCNGCMGAAKQAGRNPRDLAATIAPRIAKHAAVDRVDVAGPGFLNITLPNSVLADRVVEILDDPKHGAGVAPDSKKLVVDFGGPNVAKSMHVGHLRSAVIGDTLVRVLRFLGDDVTGDVHLGDWGLQMGLLIIALEDELPALAHFREGVSGAELGALDVTMEDLSRLYPIASARAKTDQEYERRAQKAVAKMQDGHAGYRALLSHFICVSVAALKRDYAFLDVSFDLWNGESDVDHLIPVMIETFKQKGLARLDDGAWIVDIALPDDKKEFPPVILVNSRGATGYHATDLATIIDRVQTFNPDEIIYVVDQRQAFHFEQVFRASQRAGFMPENQMEFVGFGTVNGSDGKPFKTRAGGTLRLADLNALALAEAEKKIGEAGLSGDIQADERDEIARLVARAALRFADLKNQRTTNYVFELDKFSSFEGKTGPYLLYAAVRIKALLRRASDSSHASGPIQIVEPTERKIALTLDRFALALSLTRTKRMPHHLCEHVYALAQAFSAFYADLPIAKADDPEIRASRLAICEAVLAQLETGLDLLGITAPNRM